jgi:trigger factor
VDPNQFAQSLDQEGQIPAMVAEVARRKALASVLEKVAVKDTAGNVVDLNEAVPGTEGDDDSADSTDTGEDVADVSEDVADADGTVTEGDAPAQDEAAAKA